MTTALKDHQVLTRRRRRTRAGWTYVTIAATKADEKADAGHDQAATRAAHAEKHPLRAGWWLDGIWPRAGSTPPWWGRTLHVEVGGRAVAGLVFENRALRGGPARAQRRSE